MIAGNHDATVVDENFQRKLGWYTPSASEALKWTHNTLKKDKRAWDWIKSLPSEANFEYENKKGYMVHGSPERPLEEYISYKGSKHDYKMAARFKKWLKADRDMIFLGHTHVPFKFLPKKNEKLVMNPGSVGQPRGGDPGAELALFDTESGAIEFIRLDYDMTPTLDEMRKLHFPSQLIDRLGNGQ